MKVVNGFMIDHLIRSTTVNKLTQLSSVRIIVSRGHLANQPVIKSN